MARHMVFRFDGFDTPVRAKLLEEKEPGICDDVWGLLEEPLKMWPWHTTSTGDYFSGKARSPRKPQKTGSQATPMDGGSGRPLLLCELAPGSICYAGAKEMSFAYGDDITEPLPAKGPIFAQVVEADLDTFYKAGLHVWEAQYRTHQLVVITATREEA